MGKGKLTTEMQIFVVQQLAMFEKPSIVLQKLNDDFGVTVTLQCIVKYDILHPDLPQKWKDLFNATRKRFLEDTSIIPIANKAYRLKELDRIYNRNRAAKLENPVDQRATLEQAAKESGDVFTNRSEANINLAGSLDVTIESAIDEIYGGGGAKTKDLAGDGGTDQTG